MVKTWVLVVLIGAEIETSASYNTFPSGVHTEHFYTKSSCVQVAEDLRSRLNGLERIIVSCYRDSPKKDKEETE